MNARTLLKELEALGVEVVVVAEDKLQLSPASRIPAQMRPIIIEYKVDLLAVLREPLPEPSEAAEELARLYALGQRLDRGEITAILCGKTGKLCRLCKGVPCWGSVAWEDARA